MICNCGRDLFFLKKGGYNCVNCLEKYYDCKCSNIKKNNSMPKITYFDGDKELYSHNLDADKVVIDGKEVWKKNDLKVGDKVIFIKFRYEGITAGEIGTVVEIVSYFDKNIGDVIVSFDGLCNVRVKREYIAKAVDCLDNDTEQLKVGDKVKVIKDTVVNHNNSFPYYSIVKTGEIGIVNLTPDTEYQKGFVAVNFKDSIWYYSIKRNNLIKIDNNFEVGNYVRVIINTSLDYQKCGKVVRRYSDDCLVEFSDFSKNRRNIDGTMQQNIEGIGHYEYYKHEDLERVK